MLNLLHSNLSREPMFGSKKNKSKASNALIKSPETGLKLTSKSLEIQVPPNLTVKKADHEFEEAAKFIKDDLASAVVTLRQWLNEDKLH